jgi:hypothetical protein
VWPPLQVAEPISGSAGSAMDACEGPALQQKEYIAYCAHNSRRLR